MGAERKPIRHGAGELKRNTAFAVGLHHLVAHISHVVAGVVCFCAFYGARATCPPHLRATMRASAHRCAHRYSILHAYYGCACVCWECVSVCVCHLL